MYSTCASAGADPQKLDGSPTKSIKKLGLISNIDFFTENKKAKEKKHVKERKVKFTLMMSFKVHFQKIEMKF